MKRLAVFDLDGTIADTALDLLEALNDHLEAFGLPPYRTDFPRERAAPGMPWLLRMRLLENEIDASEDSFNAHYDSFYTAYENRLLQTSTPFDGLKEALEVLHRKDVGMAVCTLKRGELARKLLRHLKIESHFLVTCGADEVTHPKPRPEHLIETIKAAGGADAACLVGDSETDASAAWAAGIPFVFVPSGSPLKPNLRNKADFVVDDFASLPAIVEEATAGNL